MVPYFDKQAKAIFQIEKKSFKKDFAFQKNETDDSIIKGIVFCKNKGLHFTAIPNLPF